MYTVSKGPSKLVAKTTRRGISQNYEKFDSIRDMSRRNGSDNSDEFEQISVPKPVFATKKAPFKQQQQNLPEESLSPQHEELVKYINESWNMVAAQNPYDAPASPDSSTSSISSLSSHSSYQSTNSSSNTTSTYYTGTPSPVLNDFKPFDLETWWGRRLYNNITKNV